MFQFFTNNDSNKHKQVSNFSLTQLERNYVLNQTNQRSLLNTTNHKITARLRKENQRYPNRIKPA